MNLLLYVLTLLLVIGAISYQALERFTTGSYVRIAWDRYMRIETPCNFNEIVQEEYKDREEEEPTPKQNNNGEKKETNKSKGAAKINFRYLVDPEYAQSDKTTLMTQIFKNLLDVLYGDQKFYRDALQKKPQIVDEILHNLKQVNAERAKKVKKVANLDKLVLPDADEEKLWYEFRKPNYVSLPVLSLLTFKPQAELRNVCDKFSILNYITDKSADKIRVNLAPRALLYALFKDEQVVKEVIQMRQDLRDQVANDAKTSTAATQEFKAFAEQFSGIAELEPILDYLVNKTNPEDYDTP